MFCVALLLESQLSSFKHFLESMGTFLCTNLVFCSLTPKSWVHVSLESLQLTHVPQHWWDWQVIYTACCNSSQLEQCLSFIKEDLLIMNYLEQSTKYVSSITDVANLLYSRLSFVKEDETHWIDICQICKVNWLCNRVHIARINKYLSIDAWTRISPTLPPESFVA